MPEPEEFTGERFLPECTGEIWAEHWHRYLFAAGFVADLEVLDIACGEGYGSSLLARKARTVTGVDIDEATVANARNRYRGPNLRFAQGSVSAIPFPDRSFDCVVSFETLEHVAEQEEMLSELKRVLRPTGFVIVSTPNRIEYSDKRAFRNEFHVRELDGAEFRGLLARHFGAQRWHGQRLLFNSGMWPLESRESAAGITADWVAVGDDDRRLPEPMYFVAFAAATADRLPESATRATLLADPDDTIYREYESTVSRARTLEQLVTARERIVIERDRQIAELDAAKLRLESLVVERDRQLDAQAERTSLMEQVIDERDRQVAALDAQKRDAEARVVERDGWLADVNRRIADAETAIAGRERVVVERDRQLEAINESMRHAEALLAERERIIAERDEQIAALDAQKRHAEAVIAERDAQIAGLDVQKQLAESLIADRERIIVERDGQLAALNARFEHELRRAEQLIAERERIIVERDAQLAATNDRMALAERVIAEREATIAGHNARIARLQQDVELVGRRAADIELLAAAQAERLAAIERANVDLETEVVRRASWRWWMSLPLRRIRKTVPTSIGTTARNA